MPRKISLSSRREFLHLGFGLAAVSLAACSQPAPTPSAAPTQAPAPAAKPAQTAPTAAPKPAATTAATPMNQAPAKPKTLEKVRSSNTASGFELAYISIGKHKGLYAEEGVDIEFVDLQDGVAQLKALLSGETLMGMMGTAAVLAAIEKGAEIKVIGAPRPKLNMVLYVRNEINTLEDLYDKPVGVAGKGALLHQIMVTLYQRKGLDPDRLEWVNIGSSPNVFKAVLAGKVMGGPSTFDFIPIAEQDGNVKVIANFATEIPEFVRSVMATTDKAIKDQPDLIERTLAGYAKSIRYGIEHGEEIVQVAQSDYGIEPEVSEFARKIEVRDQILEPNLNVTPEQLQWMQERNVESGEQSTVLPFEKVAMMDLQKKMLARIGTWSYPKTS